MCVEEEKAVEKEWGGFLLLFYQVKYFKIMKCYIRSRGNFSPDSLQKNSNYPRPKVNLGVAPRSWLLVLMMMLGCLLVGEAQPTPPPFES